MLLETVTTGGSAGGLPSPSARPPGWGLRRHCPALLPGGARWVRPRRGCGEAPSLRSAAFPAGRAGGRRLSPPRRPAGVGAAGCGPARGAGAVRRRARPAAQVSRWPRPGPWEPWGGSGGAGGAGGRSQRCRENAVGFVLFCFSVNNDSKGRAFRGRLPFPRRLWPLSSLSRARHAPLCPGCTFSARPPLSRPGLPPCSGGGGTRTERPLTARARVCLEGLGGAWPRCGLCPVSRHGKKTKIQHDSAIR